MALCDFCNGEMLEVATCLPSKLRFTPKKKGGAISEHARIVNGMESRGGGHAAKCHDCGVQPGGHHHPGCDWEECPRCGGQLITCDCNSRGVFADVFNPPPQPKKGKRK